MLLLVLYERHYAMFDMQSDIISKRQKIGEKEYQQQGAVQWQ
jgi:hypothetical protein